MSWIRSSILIFLVLLGANIAQSQVHIFADHVSGAVGDQVVVPVRANNFTNMVSMQGTVHFDPAIVGYVTVEQFGLPGMSIGSFGTTQSAAGTITFSWFDGDLSGESIADSSVLFALRLSITGNPGDVSQVWLDDTPTLLEFVDNTFSQQAYTLDPGEVTVDGNPGTSGFTLFGDSLIANNNDTVVVPIRVKNFNHIIGVQGTIGFDETVADYIGVEQYGVPGMTSANFGETMVNSGILTYSWNSLTTSGETLPDSSVLFGVKYHVIGAGGSNTDISFLNSPTLVEVVDSTLTVLNPFLSGGHIEVLPDTTETFEILIDSVVGMETQLVNVPIRAWAFNDIISMQGTFGFDTSVIHYNTVVNINLPYMSLSNFGTTQVNNGLLSFSWFDMDLSSETIPDSTVLFQLQFQVVGDVNSCGPITLNSDLTPIEVVELGNLQIPYQIDTGAVCVDSLGAFLTIQDPLDLHYCAGDSITLTFQTNLSINPGNIYSMELSDENGGFLSPTVIGTLASTLDSTSMTGFIPVPFTMGSGYRIRISSSDAPFVGDEINVDLTIEYFEDSVDVTLCHGDSLFLQGAWQTAAGTYSDTLSTVNGCDSVVVTNLNYLPEFVDTVYLTICDGDSIQIDGAWQTTAGWYVDSLTSQQGCDSLIRTNLTVNPVAATSLSTSICVGDSLFVGGAWQVNPGVYMDTLTAANSCDSIVTTTVSFYPSDTTTLSQEICFGDSLFVQGGWQTTSGTYTDILTSAFGCDSIVHTQLTVIPPVQVFDSVEVCFGDSLFVQGAWQTGSGDFSDTLVAASGCDSIIYTNLVVNDLISDTTAVSICFGDSLFVQGAWQTTPGIYTDSYTSVDGCDSLEVTNLTIQNLISSTSSATICSGDSLMIHGQYESTAGLYTATLTAANGCDSISNFTLSIESHPLYHDSLQICVGDSVFLQGAWQTTSGNYNDTLASALGCDSIIQTNLNVINTIQTTILGQICAGDSLFVEGAWQTVSGSYSDTLTAAAGCDSIVTTNLTVLAPIVGSDNATICQGDSILIDGVYQSAAGVYTEVYTAANGCDSTVSITLTVNPSYYVQNTVTICQGDSSFLQGAYQTTAGVYLDTNMTALGCDSIIETTLNVNPIVVFNNSVSICQGDSILIHGNYQSTAGVYSDTFTAATGCDSIANITLVVNPTYFAQTTATICQGDSILLEGAYQMTAGVYFDTTLTVNGCDSIVETTLTINPTYFTQTTLTICQGDSALLQGAYQTTSGVYLDTNTTVAGCDSIIETTLTVTPAPESFQTITICQGDSTLIHGVYQSTAGTYIDTIQTPAGCDSILNVTLALNPTYLVQEAVSICQGDSVMLQGAYQFNSGVYYDTTATVLGCDSIVETTLTVNPAPQYAETVNICQGDSALIHGVYQNTAGIYSDTIQTPSGCDSISNVTLVVNQNYFVQESLSICQGDSVLLQGAYQNTSGVYLDTTSTVFGCDSIVETTLTVDPAPFSSDNITICDGDSVFVNGTYLSAAGVYTDTLQTASGCDSIVETTLSVTVIDNTVTNNSPTLTANYAGAQSYQWINCDTGFEIANATSQSHTFVANGSYQVMITDQGCSVFSECETVGNVSLEGIEADDVRIFPNPTNGIVTVVQKFEDMEMSIVDVFGKTIVSRVVGSEFTISLEDQPSGVYFLILGNHSFKLVKQ